MITNIVNWRTAIVTSCNARVSRRRKGFTTRLAFSNSQIPTHGPAHSAVANGSHRPRAAAVHVSVP
jgi:hypothetical protein